MAFDLMEDDVSVISKLGDEPNEDDGLTSAELKAKFDEAPGLLKAAFNKLVNALNGTTAASLIGFTRSNNIPANNVQDAIENVQSQIVASSTDSITDRSVTAAKLADGAAGWEDISNDVTIDSTGVSSFNKIFRYSRVLGIVFFQLNFYTSGSVSLYQTGKYIGAFQYYSAVACDNVNAAAGLNCRVTYDSAPSNRHVVNVASGFSGGYVTLTGWYFCNGE